MPFQSTDQPAMTPSSNAGARSLTFVHAFEVGERKLCAMLVWLCSKCDGVHILMNSKVLVVGTTFSLARLSQCCNICSINIAKPKAGTPARRVGHTGAANPQRPCPPWGPALELGGSEPFRPKCMYACTCCAPALRAAACAQKKQEKRTEGQNWRKKNRTAHFSLFCGTLLS